MFDLIKKFFYKRQLLITLVLYYILGFMSGYYSFLFYTFVFLEEKVIESRSDEKELSKNFHWNDDPILINCIGPEIKETTIIQSIKFWEKKGHNILFYEYEPQLEICKTNYYSLEGFIVLRKEDEIIKELDDNVLASTYRKLIFSEIKSAEIIFSEGSYNYSLLLEHEMGHAFGYGHISKFGHLMNPYYGLMGEKF